MRVLVLAAAAVAVLALEATPVYVPFEDARPILAAHGRDVAAAAWPEWAARRDAEIRGRLGRGDDDSLVYLWLYGTSFTAAPRATQQEVARLGADRAAAVLLRRLDDLVAAIAAPGTNERLQFARERLAAHGIDPRREAGREEARQFLAAARDRVIAENEQFRAAAEAAKGSADASATYATLFSDRGLSSDTRLTAGFAVDRALAALAAADRLPRHSVRRAAVVGPGLDFTDKAEGYDFYPPQTIQPFALIDSLVRRGLAETPGLGVATLDLSPRVNAHLDGARRRARAGRAYALQLPLPQDDPRHEWQAEFVTYWNEFGSRIGRVATPIAGPTGFTGVRVRAVSVSPATVLAIVPHDVNIIVQRLAPLDAREQFDLVVATNILVYYDAFDQALALSNIDSMLRPGGYLLTNYAVAPSAAMESALTVPVFFDRQGNGDTMYAYRRR